MTTTDAFWKDDPEMVELRSWFAGELMDRIHQIQNHAEQEGWTPVRTIAHQLRGAGSGYGFPEITQFAADLEDALCNTPIVKERVWSSIDRLAETGQVIAATYHDAAS